MTIGPQVKLPKIATKGEIIRIKTKIKHPMETGWRKNAKGETVPRNRIHTFICDLDGTEVFRADFFSGVSADPYLAFYTKASTSGTYRFTWIEDSGRHYTTAATIQVNEVPETG